MSEHYFTFPLQVLWGPKRDPKTKKPPTITPFECIDLALDCAMLNAGRGYRKNNGNNQFAERLGEACDNKKISRQLINELQYDCAELLLGADLCGVSLGGGYDFHSLDYLVAKTKKVASGGPLVRMKGDYFWPAFYQAKVERDNERNNREHKLSWREFRILCAILSMKLNRANFAFIGWEVIQVRSCGFTTKEAFKAADSIPDHLAPPLSRKQIRITCDALEALGFYARFRFSTGKTGGYMAYSVRHTRDELATAVCDFVNFRDRAGVKANREADAKKCLEMLERAKAGPRQGQG